MIDLQVGFLSLILLLNILTLGSSRLKILIKNVAVAGTLVSILPLLFSYPKIAAASVAFAAVMMLVKGFIIPGLLYFSIRKVSDPIEQVPIIGYHISVIIGIVFILLALLISSKLSLHHLPSSPTTLTRDLLFATAISTIFVGLFLLMTRWKAITQVLGYLIMENGIYLLGTIVVGHMPYILEVAVLLDLLVAVMIMGIVLLNINETFNDIDTSLLVARSGSGSRSGMESESGYSKDQQND
ncbi:MAG: hydrogenase [Oligoflexia bacterium]|nr:hydrogenase [Oligoflexia bacterium]